VQYHLQVSPQDYAPNWNAAQCIAGVRVALGANSPFLFGKQLWRETRVALFEPATDTRPLELKEQGVRPRVWFGERWITSVFDQFEENVRYFPALLPVWTTRIPSPYSSAATPVAWASCGCTTARSTTAWCARWSIRTVRSPLAHQGLEAWRVDSAARERLLGVIEQRCIAHLNGAEWQVRMFQHIDEQRQPLDRRDALREMLRRYVEHMHSNEPVHNWPLN
jgi:hypothetical protein